MKKYNPLFVVVVLLLFGFWVFQKPEEQNSPISAEALVQDAIVAEQAIEQPASSVERQEVMPQVLLPMDTHISGIVLGPDGLPIAGAKCGLYRMKSPDGFRFREEVPQAKENSVESVISNQEGEFRIPASAGFWRLHIEAPGMARWEDAPLQAGDFRRVRMDHVRTLSVQVWDESEAPVASAEIQLVKNQSASFVQRPVQSLLTDSLGFAVFENFPSGKWFLRITHKSHSGKLVEVLPSSSTHQKVEVHLVRGVRVFGHVYAGSGQGSPANSMVYLDTGFVDGFSGAEKIVCASDGSYESHLAVQPGQRMEVTGVAAGYGEQSVWVSVAKDALEDGLEVDIHLPTVPNGLVGRVVNREGEPIPDVEIYGEQLLHLPHATQLVLPSWDEMKVSGVPSPSDLAPQYAPNTRARYFAKTDQGGRFEILQLDPSKGYEFHLSVSDYANKILYQVDNPPGEVTDIGDLVMKPAGKVFGRVVHENGMPVSEVRIRTLGKISTHYKFKANTTIDVPRMESRVSGLSTYTNREGEFLMTSFPEALAPGVGFELVCAGTYFGPYHLSEGEALGPLELVVKEQGESEVPVQFIVHNRNGEPIAKALAQVIRVNQGLAPEAKASFFDWTYSEADSNGKMQFSGISPGTYELRVMDLSGVYATLTKEIVLVDNLPFEETIVLDDSPNPPQEVRGTVLDSNGEPLANMIVVIEPATGNLSCSCFALTATTDVRGDFNLGSFMEGDHRISIVKEDSYRPLAYYYPARPGAPVVIYVEE